MLLNARQFVARRRAYVRARGAVQAGTGEKDPQVIRELLRPYERRIRDAVRALERAVDQYDSLRVSPSKR